MNNTEKARSIFALFNRADGSFLTFTPDTPEAMSYDTPEFDSVRLSAGQTARLVTLTDGDNHINAYAKNLGLGKARIYSY